MKKHLNRLLVIAGLGLLVFSSCQKQETKIFYQSGTPPTLSASIANNDTIPLITADSLSVAISFTWTNPNFIFSDGLSSQNVNYNIQIDTLGSNFTNPALQTISSTGVMGTSITVKQLNTMLAGAQNLKLAPSQPHNLQIRLVAYVGQTLKQAQVASNVLNFIVTPYPPPPAVPLPSSGELYLVGGDVLLGNWANSLPFPASQQFTQVSATEYTLKIALSGGDPTQASDQYLLIPVAGNWGYKYACMSTSAQPFSGGTFGYNNANSSYGANFPGPISAGTYLFDVNFQTGVITVTKQ